MYDGSIWKKKLGHQILNVSIWILFTIFYFSSFPFYWQGNLVVREGLSSATHMVFQWRSLVAYISKAASSFTVQHRQTFIAGVLVAAFGGDDGAMETSPQP